MTIHDDLEVVRKRKFLQEADVDAAVDRITEHVAELEAKKDLYEQVVGSKRTLLARLRRYEKALREIVDNEYDDSGDGPNYVTIALVALGARRSHDHP